MLTDTSPGVATFGRLGAAQFAGFVTLHADRSANPKSFTVSSGPYKRNFRLS
jgi:hypothetical protein